MTQRAIAIPEIKAMQRALLALGFYRGEIDGIFGTRSEAAVKAAQELYGHEITGRPTLALLVELGVVAAPPQPSNPITDFVTGLAVKAVASKIQGALPMNIFSGYKTYIVAVVVTACALLETIGVDIPSFDMSLADAIAVAVGLIFARAGAKADVAKS